MKAAIALLLILGLGLGVALVIRHNKAVKEQQEATARIFTLNNKLNETSASRDDAQKMVLHLESMLNLRSEELNLTSNSLTKVKTDLAKTQQEAAAAAEAAKAEMAKRDSRIAELNAQLDDQTKKMVDLNTAIEGLSKLISETERKLAAADGDRSFLLKELRRMQAEKADLERQFNDLALLKTQVSKLKEELSIARRLEWIRMGIYGQQTQKGAEKLLTSANQSVAAKSNFNLNVELRQDSGAVVVPPKTNAPAPPKK
jgi:chromosome segregation ATPase